MDYLGNSPTTGLTIQDKNKLDGIGIEETGEISFQNGIIVNGGTTELKTIQLEVEDDILKINRDSSANKSGITIKNQSDGKHSNILNNAGTWSFVSNASTETETNLNLAPIKCGSINSINVQEFFDNFQLHRNDGLYHAPLLDDNVSQESIWSSSKVSQELLTNAQASTSQLNNFVNNTYTPFQNSTNAHISDDDKHREINDVLTSTTALWSSNKINTVLTDTNNTLNLHTSNNLIHAELDDDQTSQQTLWSSDKIQSELTLNSNGLTDFIDNTYTPFETSTNNHVANLDLHREINDALVSTTSLWSSDKIQDQIDLLSTKDLSQDQVILALETVATRTLIQDATAQTKILLQPTKLTTTSDEHSIVYNQPSGGNTQPYQPLWSNVANRISPDISLAAGRTTANFTASIVQRVVVGDSSQDFTINDLPRVLRFQIDSANNRSIAIGLVNITDSGLPVPVNTLPQPYHATIKGYNNQVNTDWALSHYNVFTPVFNEFNDLFPSSNTPAFQNGDIIRFDIDAIGNLTISQEFTSGSVWETQPPVSSLLAGKTYSVIAWDFSGTSSSAGITLLQGEEPSIGGSFTPVEKINVTNIVDIKSDTNVGGNLTVSGNFTCNGTQTILNTTEVDVEDVLIKLASNNLGNLNNMGIYGTYNDGIQQRYSGLVRRASDGVYFLVNSNVEPTPTGILSTSDLAPLRVQQILTNTVLSNDPFTSLIVNPTGSFLEFNPLGFTRLNTSQLIVNNVEQDVRVSAYGQYHYNYPVDVPFQLLANSSWASAFPITLSNANNVLYTPATNEFTIQIAGRYRFSYHISLQNLDDDADFIVASLRANGLANGVFENSSKSRHYRMKNRANTLSATFYSSMNVGDTVRLYLTALDGNNTGTSENILVYDVNVNLERIFQNV